MSGRLDSNQRPPEPHSPIHAAFFGLNRDGPHGYEIHFLHGFHGFGKVSRVSAASCCKSWYATDDGQAREEVSRHQAKSRTADASLASPNTRLTLRLRLTAHVDTRHSRDSRSPRLSRVSLSLLPLHHHPLLPLVLAVLAPVLRLDHLRLIRLGRDVLPVPELVVAALACRTGSAGDRLLLFHLGRPHASTSAGILRLGPRSGWCRRTRGKRRGQQPGEAAGLR